MEYNIAVVKGDGIGPEIVSEAMLVLDKVGEKFGHKFGFQEVLAGGCSIDKNGIPLTDETIEICKNADSVLLGAVGGPKWDDVPSAKRPEKALLGLRAALGLFVNLRPAQMHKALADACPIKPEIIGDGFDILVCRELTGDVYFGKHYRRESDKGWGETGADDMNYSVYEVERIGRRAFELARLRRGKVSSVDKANVLETSRLWREIVHRVHDADYADVELENLLVENSDEPYADRIAKAVIQVFRRGGTVDTTRQLYALIEGALSFLPAGERKEAVKKSCQRTFQALRIDVNSEFEVLYAFLDKLPHVLKPGGRAAILTFHSGEDRLVKQAFRQQYRDGLYSDIAQEVTRPSPQECRRNPRAHSTKLRWAVRAE